MAAIASNRCVDVTISIRPATPVDDEFLAWAILTASRGHLTKGWFDIALARSESFCLAYIRELVLSEIQAFWNYSMFHVAEMNGTRVGALAAFKGGKPFQGVPAALRDASRTMGFSDVEHQELLARGEFIYSCIMDAEDSDVWTIEHGATLGGVRNRGVFDTLLSNACEVGRRAGARLAQGSFLIGNGTIGVAMANAGFEFAEDKRSPEFEAAMGAPGFRRVTRAI